jgi:TDG/mug DNA glycosylase family protein
MGVDTSHHRCAELHDALSRYDRDIVRPPAAFGVMINGLPDLITDDLKVLFCGINPGLQAAATGFHFVNRSNRFWRAIHLAGFTPEEIAPQDDRRILDYRCGLTTFVARPTAGAHELSGVEFSEAAAGFAQRIAPFTPRYVAFLGKAAFAALSGNRQISWGLQAGSVAGASLWVLPNPSGRNRAFTLIQLVDAYRDLRLAAFCPEPVPTQPVPLNRGLPS